MIEKDLVSFNYFIINTRPDIGIIISSSTANKPHLPQEQYSRAHQYIIKKMQILIGKPSSQLFYCCCSCCVIEHNIHFCGFSYHLSFHLPIYLSPIAFQLIVQQIATHNLKKRIEPSPPPHTHHTAFFQYFISLIVVSSTTVIIKIIQRNDSLLRSCLSRSTFGQFTYYCLIRLLKVIA